MSQILALRDDPIIWEPSEVVGFAYVEPHGDDTVYLIRNSLTWKKALVELPEEQYLRLIAGTISHEFLHLTLQTMKCSRASDRLDKLFGFADMHDSNVNGLYGFESLFEGIE